MKYPFNKFTIYLRFYSTDSPEKWRGRPRELKAKLDQKSKVVNCSGTANNPRDIFASRTACRRFNAGPMRRHWGEFQAVNLGCTLHVVLPGWLLAINCAFRPRSCSALIACVCFESNLCLITYFPCVCIQAEREQKSYKNSFEGYKM